MFTETDVLEFQELFRKHFGVKLDHDAAYYKLAMLVRQMELIYRPITKQQLTKYKNEYGDDNEREPNIY